MFVDRSENESKKGERNSSTHLYAPYIWPVVSACAMLMSLSDDDAMVTEMLSGSFFTLNHVVCMPC